MQVCPNFFAYPKMAALVFLFYSVNMVSYSDFSGLKFLSSFRFAIKSDRSKEISHISIAPAHV
jgi:hypothetical protein